MGQAVEQSGDGSGIGEDQIPFFEDAVGGNEEGTALIAAVGGVSVIAEITDLCRAFLGQRRDRWDLPV